MINAPSHLNWFNKFTDWMNLEPDPRALARILLWALGFLILFHIISPRVTPELPHHQDMQSVGLTPLATTPSDSRYMRRDLKTLPDNSVVWVSGSSIAIKDNQNDTHYTYLPEQVQPYLPDNMKQYVSLKMARRMLDTYTMTLDALSRKPDMLIVTLNPFWAFNDKSLFFKNNVINHGASSWWNWHDLPLIPLLVSPGDLLWATTGQHHNITASGYDYLKKTRSKYATPKKQKKTPSKRAQKISYNQPLLFWITQKFSKDEIFIGFDATQWQLEALNQNDLNNSRWGEKLLTQMLDKIKASDVPALLYLAPPPNILTCAGSGEKLKDIQETIDMIAAPYQSKKLKIITDIPPEISNSMKYWDYLHLQDSGDFPAYLGNEISKLGKKE